MYVFCILAHRDKATVDSLNIDQWEFQAIATQELNEQPGDQKSATLGTLISAGAQPTAYEEVSEAVDRVAGAATHKSECVLGPIQGCQRHGRLRTGQEALIRSRSSRSLPLANFRPACITREISCHGGRITSGRCTRNPGVVAHR